MGQNINETTEWTENYPGGLASDLVDRANIGALAAYDKAIKSGETAPKASLTAKKEYDDILSPWTDL